MGGGGIALKYFKLTQGPSGVVVSVSISDPISSSFIVVAWAKWLLAGPTQFSKFLPCRSSPLTLSLVRQDRDISYWNGCLTVSGSDTTRHTRILGPSQSQVPILSPVSNDVPLIDSLSYTWLWCTAPLPTFALSVSVNYFSQIKARIPIVGCKPWIKFINTLCFDTFPDPALHAACIRSIRSSSPPPH